MTNPIDTPSNPYTLTPELSPETLGAVASVAEYAIEAEYGADNRTSALVARTLARAAIEMDLVRGFVETNGSVHGLRQYADTVLRMATKRFLAARLCQCTDVLKHGGKCTSHTEADVPEINGKKLCGTCYATEHKN